MMEQLRTGNGRTRVTHERSIGDLIGDLADETRTLVQQEVRLASAEMGEKAGRIGRNSAKVAVGGMVLYAGLLLALAGIAIGVALLLAPAMMPWNVAMWVAPLLVGLVVGFIGYAMLQHGMHQIKETDLTPRETARSLRETKRWMQTRMM